MVVPGITEKMLSKLKEEDSSLVREHLSKVKAAIDRKQALLKGDVEELGEAMPNPKEEGEQLLKLISDLESEVDSEFLASLMAIEVSLREIVTSIEEEHSLLYSLESSNLEDANSIREEMEGELILGRAIEHQINHLDSISRLSKQIMKKALAFKIEKRKELIDSVKNINDIVSYLSRLIFEDEIPNLEVAYSLLRFEAWPAVEKKISEIRSRFVELEPKVL